MIRPAWTRGILIVLVLTAGVSSATAQNRYFVGARNLGMGNTGVANTTNGMAVHFNPAGMAFNHGWDIQLPLVTVDATVSSELFLKVDQIVDAFEGSGLAEIQARFDDGTATREDLETALDVFLYRLPDLGLTKNGGNVRGIGGPAFRWKNWGFSVSVLGNGGVDTTIDLENGLSLSSLGFEGAIPDPTPNACGGDTGCLGFAAELIATSEGQLDQDRAEMLVAAGGSLLGDDPRAQDMLTRIVEATVSGDGTLAGNQTGALTTVLAGVQFTGSYSRLIWKDQLSVGGSLKVLKGEVSVSAAYVVELESGRDTLENVLNDLFDREATTSTEVALDVGLMYRPTDRWSIGLVGNNLNSPTFDVHGGDDLKLAPLVRAGAAYTPAKWVNVALDVDLNEVESGVLQDYSYQYVNVGAEFLAGKWFSGWIGGYENLAADSSMLVITAGVGFRLGRFELSLAGAMAQDEFQIASGDDSDTFPHGAAASFTLAWNSKPPR